MQARDSRGTEPPRPSWVQIACRPRSGGGSALRWGTWVLEPHWSYSVPSSDLAALDDDRTWARPLEHRGAKLRSSSRVGSVPMPWPTILLHPRSMQARDSRGSEPPRPSWVHVARQPQSGEGSAHLWGTWVPRPNLSCSAPSSNLAAQGDHQPPTHHLAHRGAGLRFPSRIGNVSMPWFANLLYSRGAGGRWLLRRCRGQPATAEGLGVHDVDVQPCFAGQ